MKIFEVYKNFFYALDYVYDNYKNKELGNFLSEANPFLFNDEGSADSCIYYEFKKIFLEDNKNEDISEKDVYNWIVKYINKLDNSIVKEAFSKISFEMWINSLK